MKRRIDWSWAKELDRGEREHLKVDARSRSLEDFQYTREAQRQLADLWPAGEACPTCRQIAQKLGLEN